MRTWLITRGSPAGLGMAYAEAALDAGDRVVLTVRRTEPLREWAQAQGDRALVLPLDVTDPGQVREAVPAAETQSGVIDVLVNNAGRGWYGSVEGMSEAAVRNLFELNFFAVLSVTGEEVRAVSPAGQGGNLTSSRLLLRQSALVRLATGYIDGAVISLDGSSVTVVEMNTPGGSADNIVAVVQVSAATGRQLSVRYRVDTGDGFLYRAFSSDPSGRYLLLDVGPTSGTVNGWIDDGRLAQLTPANGTYVIHEAW